MLFYFTLDAKTKGTYSMRRASLGAIKLHFRVLDSEPLVVWSLDGMLLWVLPVKHCIGLETTGQSQQKQANLYTTIDITVYGIVMHDVHSEKPS